MLSPNDGYNETGLTMQSAGRFVKHGNLSCSLAFLKEVSFGHWKVTRGCDTFAFRHSSLGQADVRQLLESEPTTTKSAPLGQADSLLWSVLLQQTTGHGNAAGVGLVLSITPRTSKNKKRAACSPNILPMQSQKPSK